MDRFVLGSGAAAMQLSFQIVNNAGGTPAQNVIYITDDASYNQVSLQVELTSGSTTLSPGTIPDPSSPPSTGTTIYLDLSGLQLTPAAWKQLKPSAAGWTFKTFPEEGVIGMTPASSIQFTSGTSGVITIGIAGIVVPQALATPLVQLYADYYGVPGVQGMYSAFADHRSVSANSMPTPAVQPVAHFVSEIPTAGTSTGLSCTEAVTSPKATPALP